MPETAVIGESVPNIWEKIGYSLAGLIAGNLAETFVMFAAKFVPAVIGLQLQQSLNSEAYSELGALALCIALFSFLGWVVIGLPVIVALPTRWFRNSSHFAIVCVGACLGPVAFVLGVSLAGRRIPPLSAAIENWYFLTSASIISATALTVFAQLVRTQKQRS